MALNDDVCDRARLARDARFDGLFFIAVRSTGIYCRPICPSPTAKRENVRYFRSAEEAFDAGYRPCLRCRPEAAPGTPAWGGTSTTVNRALRLITDGELAGQRVAQLAARLGVTARHLHRLFQFHLGASPMAVARTWRLHFAKQLISDTALPMFRVAEASGFRSVRRFNDSIRRLYGRTPSQLRRMSAAAIPAPTDEFVFRLSYRPPYDWDSILSFLANRAIPGVEEVVGATYRRTFCLGQRHGILEVRHEEKANALQARIRFAQPESLLPIVTRLRGLFDLAADSAAIASHFRSDPLLGPLVRKFPGLRVPGAWDGFELSVRAILGQQVSVAAASTLAGRLGQRFGQPLRVADSGGLTVVFPAAEALTETLVDGIPRSRALAIRSVAQSVADGRVRLTGSDESGLAELARIRGVGDWTVQYVAMRALRHPDAFPLRDLVLLRTAGAGEPLTPDTLARLAEAWRPWRAYAALYLWRGAAASDVGVRRRQPDTSAGRRLSVLAPPRLKRIRPLRPNAAIARV